MLESLHLPNLMTMAQTCRMLMVIAQDVARRRFGHILIPFTVQDQSTFLKVLWEIRTVVTGSCTRLMLTGETICHP